jgi:4-hydroxythreonine-4-phosphate dehydrogenase
MLPKILITMGDAAGIGPEISLKSAINEKVKKKCIPIIIGNLKALKNNAPSRLIKNLDWNIIKNTNKKINIVDSKNTINVINIDFPKNYKLKPGKPDKTTGKYSFLYLKTAVELLNNSIYFKNNSKITSKATSSFFCNKLVTAPISKKYWQKASIFYSGHTEALADMTNTKKYAMVFANKKVNVLLVTRHLQIKDISKHFNKKNLENSIDIAIDFLDALNIKQKRIGICSLNPHSGEDGYNGKEEIEVIKPVLKYKKYKNINFYGPKTCDAVFHKAINKKLDFVLAAYHDQGILPLKLIDFFGCINITMGLPFIRTSPGHGTAFDIAGKQVANPSAMINSVLWTLKQ